MNNCTSISTSNHVPTIQRGGVGWGILAWLIGVPLPIILLAYLLKGCFGG